MEKEDLIRPSLLSANFLDLKSDIALMRKLNITHCHFDVMDGSFVPGISFGEPVFKALKDEDIIFDVHLMVVNPLKQVRRYLQLGAKEICFHVENFDNQIDELLAIKNEYPDAKIGLAISPDTDVKVLDQLPEGLKFVRYSASKGVFNITTGIWEIGDLQVGEKQVLKIVTKALTLGEKTNKANLTSDTEITVPDKCYEEEEIDVLKKTYNIKAESKKFSKTLYPTGNPIAVLLVSVLVLLGASIKRRY